MAAPPDRGRAVQIFGAFAPDDRTGSHADNKSPYRKEINRMAGIPGMKTGGGARPGNGGARPGAGRKKKDPVKIESIETTDPKRFLLEVMSSQTLDARLRIDAAKALLPYMYQRKGETGKKEEQQERSAKVSGRFAASLPPALKIIKND